jgi:hypothetical protein
MKAYLAGAIEYSPDGGKLWRREITQFLQTELDHEIYDPTVEEEAILSPDESSNFRSYKTSDMVRFQTIVRKLINHDLMMLQNHIDYVICYWDEFAFRGAGTHGEITLAYLNGIPIYLVTVIPVREVPGWILGCSTYIFHDLESLKNYLVSKFNKTSKH